MKKLLLGMLILGSISSFSQSEHILRTKLFNLAPQDALICGKKVLGDHFGTASVERVEHLINNERYISVIDKSGSYEECHLSRRVSNVKKLKNYYTLIGNGKKTRLAGEVSKEGSLSCATDEGERITPEFLEDLRSRKIEKLLVYSIHGNRSVSEVTSKSFKYAIAESPNKILFECIDSDISSNERERLENFQMVKEKLSNILDSAVLEIESSKRNYIGSVLNKNNCAVIISPTRMNSYDEYSLVLEVRDFGKLVYESERKIIHVEADRDSLGFKDKVMKFLQETDMFDENNCTPINLD